MAEEMNERAREHAEVAREPARRSLAPLVSAVRPSTWLVGNESPSRLWRSWRRNRIVPASLGCFVSPRTSVSRSSTSPFSRIAHLEFATSPGPSQNAPSRAGPASSSRGLRRLIRRSVRNRRVRRGSQPGDLRATGPETNGGMALPRGPRLQPRTLQTPRGLPLI